MEALNSNKNIFILGSERSGSTWLSNILEVHPETEFLMEPFAQHLNLFSGFPNRNIYVDSLYTHSTREIKAIINDLEKRKYSLTASRNSHWIKFQLDRFIVDFMFGLSSATKFRVPLKIAQHKNLNLNTSEISVLHLPRKSKNASLKVIKELRLNFKSKIISQIIDDPYFIVPIRHPGAQIKSIKKLFEKKQLGELNTSFKYFIETILSQIRFSKYFDLIDKFNWKEDIDYKLGIWWLINYEVLIEDLKSADCKFLIVYHEELSEDVNSEVKKIFDFIGISLDQQVIRYLNQSSKHESRKFATMNTQRDSKIFYKKAIAAVPEVTIKKITEVINYQKILPEIEY